jgi:cytidylate kinase
MSGVRSAGAVHHRRSPALAPGRFESRAVSIVALSDSLGSLGEEIGRELSRATGCELADRDAIGKAAEQFGEGVLDPMLVSEERPTLWERLSGAKRHYLLSIEAILFEMAARDRVILAGRGSTILLARIPHVLRVHVTAPVAVRARRVEHQLGLTYEAALDLVERTDDERSARIKFLYHLDWADPLLYDLVLSTERLSVDRAVRTIEETLRDPRFTASPESLRAVKDLSLVARARATLMGHAETRGLRLHITCQEGRVSIAGAVADEGQRKTAETLVAALPGVTDVRNEITVVRSGRGSRERR